MSIVGPIRSFDANGLCCRLSYYMVDNNPDFTQRHLCPHCWRDTKYLNPGAGYCGHCGGFFEKSVVDREPVIYQDGKSLTPRTPDADRAVVEAGKP